MSALFLYKSDVTINLGAVEALFAAKGFSTPAVRQYGGWTLLHYRKQLLPQEPLWVSVGKADLCAAGTFSYRGYGLRKSLESILCDYHANRLDQAELIGAYCLLFGGQEGVTFITDPLGLLHVFTNAEQTVFSSSFVAVLKAGPKRYRVNVPAVIENALAGYVVGPETVASGVYIVDARYRAKVNSPGIVFAPHRIRPGIEAGPSLSFDACVDEQLAQLDTYFARLKPLVDEFGGSEIGLSGGYDSRLLILLAKKHFAKVSAHSAYHRRITPDEVIAQQVAEALDLSHYRCSTAKQHVEMEVEEFERNVDNTAAFFDGRIIYDYDWLNFFRTRWYREMVLREKRFSMNGLGGELYRNRDNDIYPSVNAREWIKARVIGANTFPALTRKALGELLDYHLAKASAALGEPISERVSKAQMRRYFGDVFCVYCSAVRMSVDNQIAFNLSPYLDYHLRQASYQNLPHIGLAGKLEGEMIRRLDLKVAAINSTYGYPLDRREPLARLVKCSLRGLLPLSAYNRLYALRLERNGSASPMYETIHRQQPMVRRAVELMRSPRFGFLWDRVVQADILSFRTISLGLMLLKYEDCIGL